MSVHRLVALVSATALLGLLGVASASNNYPTRRTAAPTNALRKVVEPGLREKVRSADIDGCG